MEAVGRSQGIDDAAPQSVRPSSSPSATSGPALATTHAGRTKATGAVLAADTRSKTMKRMMMSAASVLALAIAGPALAQSVSTVNQSNTGNSEIGRAHV